jgi:hypothetical protein
VKKNLLESQADVMILGRKFGGTEPNRAVVGPDARAVLTAIDDLVTYFDVIHRPGM